jgi:hypothetical protein
LVTVVVIEAVTMVMMKVAIVVDTAAVTVIVMVAVMDAVAALFRLMVFAATYGFVFYRIFAKLYTYLCAQYAVSRSMESGFML